MTTRQVELKDFSKVLAEFSNQTLAEQRKGVVSGIAKSIPLLVKASPVDQGFYAQSWAFTSTEESAILGNYAPHAPIIEWGARPFTPPIKPLLEWAKRVLGDQRVVDHSGRVRIIKAGQPKTKNNPDHQYGPHVWALARYTQKKISIHGIAPKHVLGNALPAIIENIRQELMQNG